LGFYEKPREKGKETRLQEILDCFFIKVLEKTQGKNAFYRTITRKRRAMGGKKRGN